MRSYDTLDVSREEDVLEIAFDQPEQYNAINLDCHEELAHVFDDAAESDARVVVLTGNGDAFSSGGDIEEMKSRLDADDTDAIVDSIQDGYDIIQGMIQLKKPIVARVNGHATGAGATIALFSDIVVMAEGAKIGDPHVNAGIAAGDGGAIIWPLLTDIHTAKEFLMTGRLVGASEASEMGLVNYAVPPAELDEKVDELVDELATGPQTAIGFTKVAVNGWLELGVSNMLRESLALESLSMADPDHAEAVHAFLEGRDPDFPSARDRNEE